ncbi:anaphase-promoting complex subunit 2 isoform X2 [Macrosteles quadrilineatus]|uniref:anaphase-promoting complex subunit 2 isoform X2 n=1 Tax=Macrosteles quadrilineatus TaxID=74068 RepID=UPI0023E0E1ED|nr:anaphase-promoting complex subunit 2 isoform X2 [Macrosteles quadrilineatus]
MADTDITWNLITAAFPILMDKETGNLSTNEELEEFNVIAYQLNNKQLIHFVESIIIDKIEQDLRQKIAPTFWEKFTSRESENDGFEKFRKAVDFLYDSSLLYLPTIERMRQLRSISSVNHPIYGEVSLVNAFKTIVRATLHSQLPLRYQVVTEDFYRVTFKVFCNMDKETDGNDSAEDVLHCEGCGVEVELCNCKSILEIFNDTNRKLIELDLLERLAGEVLTSLIHKRIENHVQETCKGSFDTSHITSLENWLDTVVMGWLTKIYWSSDAIQNVDASLAKFRQKLKHLLYETYTRTRIEQLFNIIIEYPDSEPAIEDLRVCLLKTDLRQCLVQKLQRALETRLLHPGVNTPDILTAYIAAIKALRQLDPTGVLLEMVTLPVRQYLRSREDTVRCVVTSLTDDGPNDLAEELARGEALQVYDNSPHEVDVENWATWNPDPIDADPSKTSKSRRTSDIISMLVNVYGSKELFVSEYRTLLADRLLSQFTNNTDKEIRYLELLKIRFGESELHCCEVMLKDMYDSKRINAHLLSNANFNLASQKYPANAIILSAQFWPPFKEETKLELPDIAKEQFDIYTKAFETLKGNRTLNWKPHLGSVTIEIELKDKTLQLTVSPIHATIIWHFQDKTQWTIEELSQKMLVPSTILRRKITFWQTQGLLKETATDCFTLVEEVGARGGNRGNVVTEMVCEDEESESAMASAHDQREEELQVFWSYIVGMLTNLDSLPLDRIHQMLKMFASQGPSTVECSQIELRHFLDRKVREHKLLFSGGLYRLPKN